LLILDDQLSEELQTIFATWTKCIQLRHKYMDQSLQSPGDNPKDSLDWTVYPKPPPPSYIPKKGDKFFHEGPPPKPESDLFDLNDLSIPEKGDEHVYRLDSDGVYRVFRYLFLNLTINRTKECEKSMYTVPTAKEYFLDLEFILRVISEGPTKSFAYRRLKYLESKFNMYILLNEYQVYSTSNFFLGSS
jgi:AMP deaminase